MKKTTTSNLKEGMAVEYNESEYKIVQLFGPDNKYATIENEKERISVQTKTLAKATRRVTR